MIITLLAKETPVNGNSSRISKDGFGHTPQQHDKENMKDHEEDNIEGRFSTDQVLKNKDEVVYGDKYKYTCELRID